MNEEYMEADELMYATLMALTMQNLAIGDSWRYQYIIGSYVLLFNGETNDTDGIYGAVTSNEANI